MFFGLCGFVASTKLFGSKAGLIFTAEGIVDNASGVSAGFIPWNEIVGGKTLQMRRQNILIIEVRDSKKYFARGNWLKRLAMTANYKMWGGAITIPSITLKASFPELLSTFNRYQQRYGAPKSEEGGTHASWEASN